MPRRSPRRIATISVHTSPLDQPGTGDAGGLNVYVVEVARRLAARGVEVEVFTRAVCRDAPPVTELAPGVLVRHVIAGPFEELDKADLPAQLCHFTLEVLRAEAAYEPGRYDLVHAHYWLSGQVGAVAKERWGVPLVQSMHTLGKVKNAALATGDCAEPRDPDPRRGGGDRGRGPAGRQHGRRGGPAGRPVRGRHVQGQDGQSRSRPGGVPSGVEAGGAAQARPARRRRGPHVRRTGAAAEGAAPGTARRREAHPRRSRSWPTGWSWRSSAGRAVPAAPTRTRSRSWRPLSAYRTWSGWSRPARSRSWPSGTGRRPPCSCRPIRSRSAWWRWKPRRAARRWWRHQSAGCAPRCGTGCPACWCPGMTRRTMPARCAS